MASDLRRKYISPKTAFQLAMSFLKGKPCGILLFSDSAYCLKKIAVKMHSIDRSQTSVEHLKALYNHILKVSPKVHTCNEDQIEAKVLPFIFLKRREELIEKGKECLSETFLTYFDKQITGKLCDDGKSYIGWLPDEQLLSALFHITLHGCEACRIQLSTRIGPAAWALGFHSNKVLPHHDYADIFFPAN